MGFPTKVQFINRKANEQYYINFPSAVAQVMEFAKVETFEWIIADKGHLILARKDVPPNPIDLQKKLLLTPEKSTAGNLSPSSARPNGAKTTAKPTAFHRPVTCSAYSERKSGSKHSNLGVRPLRVRPTPRRELAKTRTQPASHPLRRRLINNHLESR